MARLQCRAYRSIVLYGDEAVGRVNARFARRAFDVVFGGTGVTWLHDLSRHVGVADKYVFSTPLARRRGRHVRNCPACTESVNYRQSRTRGPAK